MYGEGSYVADKLQGRHTYGDVSFGEPYQIGIRRYTPVIYIHPRLFSRVPTVVVHSTCPTHGLRRYTPVIYIHPRLFSRVPTFVVHSKCPTHAVWPRFISRVHSASSNRFPTRSTSFAAQTTVHCCKNHCIVKALVHKSQCSYKSCK